MKKFIAYFRVSTDKQGIRGLGMESQQYIVQQYISKVEGELIESFIEVASGKKMNRIELEKALESCKKNKATLIVAKLDRLARDIHFISGLQKAKVKFIAADLPEANEMIVQLIAVIAEYERKQISERTINALAAAKRRGTKLGNPRIREIIHKPKTAAANDFAAKIIPTIAALQAQGLTQAKIAVHLTFLGVSTPRGKSKWHKRQIQRVIARAALRLHSI